MRDDNDTDNPTNLGRAQSWRERHAISIIGGVPAALLGLVITVQVGC